MGLFCSRLRKSVLTNKDYRLEDETYESLDEVKEALHKNGLETCQLLVGIDFTKSNTWNGKRTFGGKLHVADKELPLNVQTNLCREMSA